MNLKFPLRLIMFVLSLSVYGAPPQSVNLKHNSGSDKVQTTKSLNRNVTFADQDAPISKKKEDDSFLYKGYKFANKDQLISWKVLEENSNAQVEALKNRSDELGHKNSENPNLLAQLRVANHLAKRAQQDEKRILRELDEHYGAMMPTEKQVEAILKKWPQSLREEAQAITRSYPDFKVGELMGNLKKNEVFSQFGGGNLSQIGYLPFFRLLKDMYFKAFNEKDSNLKERLATILVLFAQKNAESKSSNELFHKALGNVLKKDKTALSDIGETAFATAVLPYKWKEHKSSLQKEAGRRALNKSDNQEKLNKAYGNWKKAPTKLVDSVNQELLRPSTASFNFLESIVGYLIQHKSKSSWRKDDKERVAFGDYKDDVTHLLKHERVKKKEENPHTATLLEEYYEAPGRQRDLLGTEDYAKYQYKQKLKEKAQIAFQHYVSEQKAKRKAEQVKCKQEFVGKGMDYGKAYYQTRKELTTILISLIEQVSKVTGVKIDFKVRPDQLNALLDEFERLPASEQRFWLMNRGYADNVAIPDLVKDLSFSEEAVAHADFQEKQSNFVTCKCGTCTICGVQRDQCSCKNGLVERLQQPVKRMRAIRRAQRIKENLHNKWHARFPVDFQEQKFSFKLEKVSRAVNICPEDIKRRAKEDKVFKLADLKASKKKRTYVAKKFKDGESWPCSVDGCNKTFKKRESKKQHENDKHALYNDQTATNAVRFPSCQKVYHDIDSLQEHLRALGGSKKSARGELALESDSKNQKHLHNLMCLACRTVFGQHRELTKHIQEAHQKKQDEVIERVKRQQPSIAGYSNDLSLGSDIVEVRSQLEKSRQQGEDIFNFLSIDPRRVKPENKRYPKKKQKK